MTDDIKVSQKSPLALDDEDLRRLNTAKLVKTVEDVGICMVEASRTSKAMYRYLYLYMGIALGLLILFVVGYLYSSGGVQQAYENLFVPVDASKTVTCVLGTESISFKKTDLESLYYFKAATNSSCYITTKKQGGVSND